jgi:hypothetical protein
MLLHTVDKCGPTVLRGNNLGFVCCQFGFVCFLSMTYKTRFNLNSRSTLHLLAEPNEKLFSWYLFSSLGVDSIHGMEKYFAEIVYLLQQAA